MALERLNPPDVFQPTANIYTQVIKSTGSTHVHVSGMVAMDVDRQTVGAGDMAAQVAATLDNIDRSLVAAGAGREDVVRMTIYTLDMDRFLAEGAAGIARYFGATSPVSTLVGVTRLADSGCEVEIQVTAVIE